MRDSIFCLLLIYKNIYKEELYLYCYKFYIFPYATYNIFNSIFKIKSENARLLFKKEKTHKK